MSFKFNFSNASDLSINDEPPLEVEASITAKSGPHAANQPQFHSLEELAATLPQNISYSTLILPQPHKHGKEILLPRRELYDVRMQLMDEDEDLGNQTERQDGESEKKHERESLAEFVNGNEDVRTGTYEGGLKSWECSVDLVKYLAETEIEELGRILSTDGPGTRVLELGCGTSLPTLFLFQAALRLTDGLPVAADDNPRFTFHLADYNHSVLRLVTLPNIVLSWILHKQPEVFTLARNNAGDISVTPELIQDFLGNLSSRGIHLSFFSGCWGDAMLTTLAEVGGKELRYDLVIGSETIYEPQTVWEFTKVLLRTVGSGIGLVGAKKIYFGVGGSVGDFVTLVEGWEGERKWSVRTVKEVGLEGSGVGRVVLEVKARA